MVDKLDKYLEEMERSDSYKEFLDDDVSPLEHLFDISHQTFNDIKVILFVTKFDRYSSPRIN